LIKAWSFEALEMKSEIRILSVTGYA